MKTHTHHLLSKTLGIAALTVFPLAAQDADMEKKGKMDRREMRQAERGLSKLVAIIHPVGGSNVKGSVTFGKEGDGIRVTADVGGLEPNKKHGFHIHEFGDLGSDDATSAGGHFNPEGHDHALPDKDVRHGGDMGNLSVDENGHATLSMLMSGIKLGAGKMGILGRAVIIHAKEDDGGQPTGNAGERIGAGIIGISKDAMAKSGGEKSMNKGKEGADADGTAAASDNVTPSSNAAADKRTNMPNTPGDNDAEDSDAKKDDGM